MASGGGKLRVADDGITETQIATTATPATGEVLGWSGTELEWVAQNAGGTGGTGRSFIVPRSGVGGSGTDFTLTTGRSLTSYVLGDRFQFRMENTPTGNMSIAVDGLPSIQLTKGGQFGDILAGVGDVRLNDGLIVTYLDPQGNGQPRFWLSYLSVGNAARRSVGDYAGALPSLDADAKLPQSTLGGSTVSTGDLLTAIAGSQQWVSPSRNGGLRVGNFASLSPLAFSSSVSVAHGLSREPDFITAYLECITAEFGYVPGDRVTAFNFSRTLSGADDTNLWVSTDDNTYPFLVNKAGGNDSQVTGANWRLVAVPYIVEGATPTPTPTTLRYTITNANVGGTADAITLTTGDLLAEVPWGTYFFFHAQLNNTGPVTVSVDGLAAEQLELGDGAGAVTNLVADDLRATFPYILIKNADASFAVFPPNLGRAAWHNTGTGEGDVALLGSGGLFNSGRLADSGATGQLLTRTATGQEWASNVAQSRWVIEDGNVGGTNDALTLTTGDSLTVIPEGADFVFRSLTTPNVGPVTVDIDGIGTVEIRSGAGGSAPGSHRPIRAGEIAARQDYIINFDGFYYGIRSSLLGIAGNYDVGLTDGSLVVLITEDGLPNQLPVSTFSLGGGVGDVLTRTTDGKRWIRPPAAVPGTLLPDP